MYICHCRAVTDRTIAAAIASGATSLEEIARRCGAGSRCGGCWPALHDLLGEPEIELCGDRVCADHRHLARAVAGRRA